MSEQVVVQKSNMQRWIERVASDAGAQSIKSRAADVAYTIRQMGEAGVVGSVLGAIDAEIGLDQRDVPLDLVGAAVGAGSAMYFAGEDYSHDLRNVGSDCFAIFTFRKTRELVKRLGGAKVSGEEEGSGDVGEEDPVVRAARDL